MNVGAGRYSTNRSNRIYLAYKEDEMHLIYCFDSDDKFFVTFFLD